MCHVEHSGKVRINDIRPLFTGHFMKWRVTRDACIVDENVDRAKLCFDFGDALHTAVIISNIPFIGFDARFICELRRGFVIPRIRGGDRISASFNAIDMAAPIPREPPVTRATLAIGVSLLVGIW